MLTESCKSVVNNAGICAEASNPQPIDAFDEAVFDTAMAVNARGVFLGCKYSVRQFKQQEPRADGMCGWIVNLASMVSSIGMQGLGMFQVNVPFWSGFPGNGVIILYGRVG